MNAALDRNNDVLISWTPLAGAARLVIVRKTRDYPQNIRDGAVVLDSSEPVTQCVDNTPVRGRHNYYRAFFQDSLNSWIETNIADDRARLFCDKSFNFQDKLYSNLPELYARNDENGELRRFLAIIAWQLEKFRAKQSGLNDISNVNEVRDDLLEHLAWNVGWILNRELPVLRQRAEIKRAVAIYKKKGTRQGLIDLLQGIIGWDMEVIKYNRNILMTNHPAGTTLKVSDPNITMNMNTSADTADYILGGDKSPDRIRIKIKATYDFHLFEQVRNKLFRILRFWIPACMSVILELATYNEESGGIGDWRPAQSDVLENNWLMTNYFTHNDFQILSERTTNNSLWRTMKISAL